jgi:hypothetical protein
MGSLNFFSFFFRAVSETFVSAVLPYQKCLSLTASQSVKNAITTEVQSFPIASTPSRPDREKDAEKRMQKREI